MYESIQEALKPAQTGETVYFTVGNSTLGDDGAGEFLYSLLRDTCVNIENLAGRPEDAYGKVCELRPAKAVFFDAADFRGEVGEIAAIAPESVKTEAISTHRIPLSVVVSMIEEDTKAETVIIGIQIDNCEYGKPVSNTIKESLSGLASEILSLYG